MNGLDDDAVWTIPFDGPGGRYMAVPVDDETRSLPIRVLMFTSAPEDLKTGDEVRYKSILFGTALADAKKGEKFWVQAPESRNVELRVRTTVAENSTTVKFFGSTLLEVPKAEIPKKIKAETAMGTDWSKSRRFTDLRKTKELQAAPRAMLYLSDWQRRFLKSLESSLLLMPSYELTKRQEKQLDRMWDAYQSIIGNRVAEKQTGLRVSDTKFTNRLGERAEANAPRQRKSRQPKLPAMDTVLVQRRIRLL